MSIGGSLGYQLLLGVPIHGYLVPEVDNAGDRFFQKNVVYEISIKVMGKNNFLSTRDGCILKDIFFGITV